MPVIWNNEVFKQYYQFKISQGKSHLCALGHCVRKLLRVIYHCAQLKMANSMHHC